LLTDLNEDGLPKLIEGQRLLRSSDPWEGLLGDFCIPSRNNPTDSPIEGLRQVLREVIDSFSDVIVAML
jgi:hypothetical protein